MNHSPTPPSRIMTQMINYNKALFDTSFSVISTLQDHAGAMMDTVCEKKAFMTENTKAVRSQWQELFKQGRTNFKNLADQNFDRVKAAFDNPGKAASESSKK